MTNQTPDHSNNAPHHVAALYHFAPLNNREDVREALLDLCMEKGVLGTILLAEEGVNGTISGSEDALAAILAHIRSWSGFAETEAKYSIASEAPFLRMKVRLKREIVSMGVEGVDAAHDKGEYLAPHEWNAALDDPDEATPKRIAMFCTGGIRCEKATAYVRAQGFADVVHLKGGILKYLEHVPPAHSKFDGECFVFDERVSVGQGLKCPHCADVRTEAQKTRYRERQRQMELAAERGAEHLAPQKTPSD
jgi:UPF0176 protein